ncbi:MAG: UDP-N-acetylmuramate--L-alanine ligase [Actinobacteria bacterium]|nr:MAG: UDP-N-acetylmuramate--L-alanine ligase [Actinomycetota bacterium]
MKLGYDRIHIVGAGGSGMSAIAKVLVGMGHAVSGSDLRGDTTLSRLGDFGVEAYAGSRPDVAREADLVVASSAVPERDAELLAAAASGVPVWRRPRLLGAITSALPAIGATGTHGKTTTTALLITAVRGLGLDPSFIVGGDIANLATNGHYGSSNMLIVEADEAFRTFEHLNLTGLVVTNVEPEHLEHFGSEAEMRRSFVTVAAAVDGPVVACADDQGSADLARQTASVTYGRSPESDWTVTELTPLPGGSRFNLQRGGEAYEVVLNRPGSHIAVNAAGALALIGEMGMDVGLAAEALEGFTGVSRRWELRGTVAGVTLIDDYAHHPTEVAASLNTAREAHPGRVWAVFQPHLYTRTERFSDEFGEALAKADRAVVTDVYGSREAPIPGINGELVVAAVRSHGGSAEYVAHRVDLAPFLAERVEAGDLVVTMGAGDVTLVPTELARLLAGREL